MEDPPEGREVSGQSSGVESEDSDKCKLDRVNWGQRRAVLLVSIALVTPLTNYQPNISPAGPQSV